MTSNIQLKHSNHIKTQPSPTVIFKEENVTNKILLRYLNVMKQQRRYDSFI